MQNGLGDLGINAAEKQQELQHLDLEIASADAFRDVVQLRENMLQTFCRADDEALISRAEFLHQCSGTDIDVIQEAR